MLSQILLPPAKERLARIAIVKAEKARAIEDMIIQMAQRGQLKSQVNEQQLIDLLETVGAKEKEQSKITIRRKAGFDSEEDDDDDDDFY